MSDIAEFTRQTVQAVARQFAQHGSEAWFTLSPAELLDGVDTGAAFPADVGGLVCFTQIEGASADAPGSIHHVWFHGDAQVADVELTARSSPWRTWSRKTVPADWTGPWHVEIRDAGGAVLKRIDFTVGQ